MFGGALLAGFLKNPAEKRMAFICYYISEKNDTLIHFNFWEYGHSVSVFL